MVEIAAASLRHGLRSFPLQPGEIYRQRPRSMGARFDELPPRWNLFPLGYDCLLCSCPSFCYTREIPIDTRFACAGTGLF